MTGVDANGYVISTPEERARAEAGERDQGTPPERVPMPREPGFYWVRTQRAGYAPFSSMTSRDSFRTWDRGRKDCWFIVEVEAVGYPYVQVFGTDEGFDWDGQYEIPVEVGPRIKHPEET